MKYVRYVEKEFRYIKLQVGTTTEKNLLNIDVLYVMQEEELILVKMEGLRKNWRIKNIYKKMNILILVVTFVIIGKARCTVI